MEPTMSATRFALPLASLRLSRLSYRLSGLAAMARSRRSLRKLDDHLLRDIGLSRSDALVEADRPAWDAPSHWKG
jgi:uncharacterized protein YjiS (DUF1127 family)